MPSTGAIPAELPLALGLRRTRSARISASPAKAKPTSCGGAAFAAPTDRGRPALPRAGGPWHAVGNISEQPAQQLHQCALILASGRTRRRLGHRTLAVHAVVATLAAYRRPRLGRRRRRRLRRREAKAGIVPRLDNRGGLRHRHRLRRGLHRRILVGSVGVRSADAATARLALVPLRPLGLQSLDHKGLRLDGTLALAVEATSQPTSDGELDGCEALLHPAPSNRLGGHVAPNRHARVRLVVVSVDPFCVDADKLGALEFAAKAPQATHVAHPNRRRAELQQRQWPVHGAFGHEAPLEHQRRRRMRQRTGQPRKRLLWRRRRQLQQPRAKLDDPRRWEGHAAVHHCCGTFVVGCDAALAARWRLRGVGGGGEQGSLVGRP
eukprot:4702727-Prymnesium_polylepis.1